MSDGNEYNDDVYEVESELKKIDEYDKDKREKYEKEMREKAEKEKKIEELKKEKEYKDNQKIQEGKYVQFPTRGGNLYLEKWVVSVIIFLFIFLLLFATLITVFGYGVIENKFSTHLEAANCSNINNNPACPACPMCPSLDCGNSTNNITLYPTFDIHLNSS